MSHLTAIGVGVVALAVCAAAPLAGAPNDEILIDKSSVTKLVKGIGKYYGELDAGRPGRAHSEYQKLYKELQKAVPKGTDDVLALLTNVEQWREILRRGALPEKPLVSSGKAKFGTSPVELNNPMGMKDDELKVLERAFDGGLKVFVSAPKDYKKRPSPVILALHPAENESNVKVKELRKSSDIVKEVKAWVASAYPQEVLDSAIVVVPILDLARMNDDGLTASRARWDDMEGIKWAVVALTDLVLNGAPHDPSRLFIDGHGDRGSLAVTRVCSEFPSMLTGAVVRGAPADNADFRNCKGMPLLFVGEACQAFADTWSQKDGYAITHVEQITTADGDPEAAENPEEGKVGFDGAAFASWLNQGENTKNYAPPRVELYTTNPFASTYWLRLNGFTLIEDVRTAEIIGEIDKDENRITITTNPLVRGFTVSLNDEILDLDKEITIVHKKAGDEGDGEVRFQGTAKRSFEDLLKYFYYKAHGNYGEAYLLEIAVDAE